MKASPTTINNPAYGYGVCEYVDAYGGAELYLEMPADFTSTQWGYQTNTWGYPSNKVKTTKTVTEGYWKGRITFMTGVMNNIGKGLLYDMIIEQFNNGLRLVKIV